MYAARIALALVLACAGCASDDTAGKTGEGEKTGETKTGEGKGEAKTELLPVEKEDVEIVVAIDKLATLAKLKVFIEADVVGKLTPKEQQELNAKYGPKQDHKGAIEDLAQRAKLKAVESSPGELHITKP